MADSLSDDFAIDGNFTVHSDGENVDVGGSDDEGQVWDNESVMSQDRDQHQHSRVDKGKQAHHKEIEPSHNQGQSSSESKKRKRKQSEKARKAKKAEENRQAHSVPIAAQLISYQADYLYNRMRKSCNFDKLSTMELEELKIREEMLQEVEFRKERSIENLQEFLNSALPGLSDSIKKLSKPTSESNSDPQNQNGSPMICLVTGNALRATDLARGLRPLLPASASKEDRKPSRKKTKPNGKSRLAETGSNAETDSNTALSSSSSSSSSDSLTVAKLFSRHLKISAQAEFLKHSKTPLAVGTPARILALIQHREPTRAQDPNQTGKQQEQQTKTKQSGQGSLRLNQLNLLVLDLSWLDSKEMNLLDVKENRNEVFNLLACDEIRKELTEGKTKIVCW